jgi:hypothetical protein
MARLVAIAVLGMLLAPATASSAVTPPTFQYTGQLQGSRAFVGIVKKGDRFRAYVSDATSKRATLSVWFRGDVGPDGHISATAYGVGLEADLERRDATGTVTLPNGRALEFAAEIGFGGGLVDRSYRHAGVSYRSGWIVLGDDRVRGRTTIAGTAFDGSLTSGPGIRPTPPIGSQIAEEQRPALCSQLEQDHEALRAQLGRLLRQSGIWELRLNRGRGSGAAYHRLNQVIGALDMTLEEVERYRDGVC